MGHSIRRTGRPGRTETQAAGRASAMGRGIRAAATSIRGDTTRMTSLSPIRNPVSDAIKPAAPQPSAVTGSTSSLGNQTTFLQLLVAQLKYHDPLQPQDGPAFVPQLAQFSDLQQQINTTHELTPTRQCPAQPP